MMNSKRNYIIVALIVLILTMAVGYALFSTSLKITGTASAKGWNLHFTSATATPGVGTTAIGTANITTTTKADDTVTVSVNLKHPGDSVAISTTITNDSAHPAKLNGLTLKTKDGNAVTLSTVEAVHTYGAIKASLNTASFADNSTISAGGTATYTLSFEWPSTYTEENVDDTMQFEITLPYQQATE